jgi:diaminohydroxyphosphoribosylaminopyrimidine deaminase/5-amino-6-(5-phosphoribosylamino)uracil reductase
VGTQTVIDDNPKLDVRDWTGGNPVRIVLDQNSRLQQKSHVLDNQIKTIVLTKTKANTNKENLIFNVINFERNIATQVTDVLYNQQIQSVIIEGGRLTLQTFIDANLWDEARIFKGTIDLKEGTAAPILSDSYLEKNTIGQDELIISINHD